MSEAAPNRALQRQAFGALVREGAYDADFDHPPHAQAFFLSVMEKALGGLQCTGELAILDCGCGTGTWLRLLHRARTAAGAPPARLFGFDLTPEMIEVARTSLAGIEPGSEVKVGDVLDDASFNFAQAPAEFSLVFAYDVIQQLPPRRQAQAIMTMIRHVAPGGAAVVFDHEAWSRYGVRMGLRKALTRALGIEFVPFYYCNARYPALGRLGGQIAETTGARAAYAWDERRRKRALILTRTDAGTDRGR